MFNTAGGFNAAYTDPVQPEVTITTVAGSVLLGETIEIEAVVVDAMRITWSANKLGQFDDATAPIISFDPDEDGEVTLTIEVVSRTGHKDTASITLNVIDPVDIPAPEITIEDIIEGIEGGEQFQPTIVVTDHFGRGLSFSWSATSDIGIDDDTSPEPTFTGPEILQAVTAQISCTITDENGKSASATASVSLIPVVITIDDIDTLHFELVTDGNVQAFPGMLNREKISIRVTDEEVPPGLTDENGLLKLDHEAFSRIEIHSDGGKKVSTESEPGIPPGIRLKDRIEAHVLMGKLVADADKEIVQRGVGFSMTVIAFHKDSTSGLVLTATQQEPTIKANTFKVNLAPAA